MIAGAFRWLSIGLFAVGIGLPGVGAAERGETEPSEAGVVGLLLTSPSAGTIVTSGATIPVVVVAKEGFEPIEVLVVGPGSAERDDSPPFELQIEIPLEAFRTYPLTAFGKDSAGNFFGSADVVLIAEPAGSLESIEIHPAEPYLLGPGDEVALRAYGTFTDGIERELPPLELSWESSAPSIVSIDANGLAKGEALGVGTITVRFEVFEAACEAKVVPPSR